MALIKKFCVAHKTILQSFAQAWCVVMQINMPTQISILNILAGGMGIFYACQYVQEILIEPIQSGW